MAENPIQTLQELSFIDRPRQLNVSHNGQYIALGNKGKVYLFDLLHPELSWQQKVPVNSAIDVTPTHNDDYWIANDDGIKFINSAPKILPTDSGAFWMVNDDGIKFINKHGIKQCNMKQSEGGNIWGNDHWLLIHSYEQLMCIDTSSFHLHSIMFKPNILHAWEHGDGLRLLTISLEQKHLFLYEWHRDNTYPKLITKFKYKQDIQIDERNGLDLQRVHAWPLDDGGVLVKLIPWAIRVSHKGRISVSTDHVAWHPIIKHQTSTPKVSIARLAELTACSLDSGMAAQSSFGNEGKPYLITTLLCDDSIHFISTEWHKRLSLYHIDLLTDKQLGACLDDQDVVTLLLANSERSLIGLEDELPKSLIHMLYDEFTEYQYTLLMNKCRNQINELFEVAFPKLFAQIIDKNYKYQAGLLKDMYDILYTVSLRPRITQVFFESFHNHFIIDEDDQYLIESSIKILIPIVPDYVLKIIPAHLLRDAMPLKQSLVHVDEQSALFLLERAPMHVFDFDTLIFALNYFSSNRDILIEIFTHRTEVWTQYKLLPAETKLKLKKAVGKIFEQTPSLKGVLQPMVIACEIMIPNHTEYPHIQFISLLVKPEISIQEVARYLASQALTGEELSSDIIETELKIIQSKRLIPSIIFTMLELANSQYSDDLIYLNKDKLAALMLGNVDNARLEGLPILITSIWKQSDELDECDRWAFAVILLAAIKRCLKVSEIVFLFSKHPHFSNYSRLTEEAQLLQNNSDVKCTLIEEILDCIDAKASSCETCGDTSMALHLRNACDLFTQFRWDK